MSTVKTVRWGIALLAMAAAGVVGAAGRASLEPPISEMVQGAADQVAKLKPDSVPTVRRLLARAPDNPEANWLLGVVLASRDDHASALACFRRIPSSHPQWAKAKLAEGDELFKLGDAVLAEAAWNVAVAENSTEIDGTQRLLALYGFQLRRTEWAAALQQMVRAERTSLREVVQLVIIGHVVWQGEGIVETLEKFVAINPDDVISRASLVQHLLAAGRSEEARNHLNVLLGNPTRTPLEAHAVISFASTEADPQVVKEYLNSGSADWRERLQKDATWLRGLGELQLQHGAAENAAQLLEAAAKREPFHPGGRQQLALAVRLLGRTEEASLHAAAADVLARLDRNAHAMQTAGSWTSDGVIAMARDAASVGMIEEAKAWLQFAQRESSEERLIHLFAKLETSPPTSRENPPATYVDPRRESLRW